MTEPHPLLAERGVTDMDAGISAAEAHFKDFLNLVAPLVRGGATSMSMGLLSMITRAQAFHSGTIAMLRADDPFSSYALTRAYAENAAALVWAQHQPTKAGGLSLLSTQSDKLVVGRIVDETAKHYPGFKTLYGRLSEYAHPVADGFHSAWHPSSDDDRMARWASVPRFKSADGPLWVLLWLMELTDLHATIWPGLYAQSAGRRAPVASSAEA